MMGVNARIFNTFFNYIKYSMAIVGLWPVAKPPMAYRSLGLFSIISNITMVMSLFRFAFLHTSQLSTFIQGLGAAGSIGLTSLKGVLMIWHKKDLLRIFETLKNYHQKSIENGSLKYEMLENVSGFRWIQQLELFAVSCTILIYITTPLVPLIQHSFTNTSTISQTLPMPTAFPWRIQPIDTLYIATYAFVSYNLLTTLCLVISVDGFFSLIIFYVTTQLRVMSYKIENLQDCDDHDKIVRNCVNEYTILRNCCAILQNIFGPIILWVMIMNSIVMCSVIFQLSQGRGISGIPMTRFILILSHVTTKIVQTFGYAYAGSALTTESKAFLNAVYSSNWQRLNRQQYRTSVLITLTQRPLEIIILKFIIVSMDTFVATMNSTVSYFFLLKTVDQKNA